MKKMKKKFKGIIRISFDTDEQLSVCEHITINANSETKENYDGAEYSDRLHIQCNVCKIIYTFKMAIN